MVTNGTAVLGLGAIGPLAAKPVMEGKAVLFKKFSGIDVFDVEIDEQDPERFCDVVASLEPTFGGINLEDVKAPECFEIESRLRERMRIPVFHDDQHGTAIIVGAAVRNALELVGKSIGDVRLVASGAGAAALACLDLLLAEVPRMDLRHRRFEPIRGEIPSPLDPPHGCHFHPRCPHTLPRCRTEIPRLREVAAGHWSACHLNDMA